MAFPARISGSKREGSHPSLGTGRIPHAKKPKSRPPNSLRDKVGFIHGTLPKYSGPYGVGVMDIEVPASCPQNFSDITRHRQHILRLETVLMTIYYPSAFGSGVGKDPAGHKKWSRSTWLPRPRVRVAQGYGQFAGLGSIAVPWFMATTMLTKIPGFRNAPLATHWPPFDNLEHGGAQVKNEAGSPPPGESEEPTFPLLVFSHGLGGNRTAYSSVCGEFASYGFVVCALEHRDGSGPRTYVNHPHAEPCVKARSPTQTQARSQGQSRSQSLNKSQESEKDKDEDCECGVDHTSEQKSKGYDRVDYIFPKNNPIDTSPNNEKGVDHELRAAQTALRLAEIEEAHRVLRLIASGDGAAVAAANLRRKGFVGASSRGLDGVDWGAWEGRFHTDEATVVGHSFGAATTVEMLRAAERFWWCAQGIIYDIWGAAVQQPTPGNAPASNGEETEDKSTGSSDDDNSDGTAHTIRAPLLGINSEAFMYWPSNFRAASSLVAESRASGAPAWLLTLRGTIHISQSDFSILYPHICSLLLKMTANPKRAMDLNINASLEFLRHVLPARHALIVQRSMAVEGVLDAPVIDRLPDVRRPDEKWIGGKLRIQHEFRSRVVPKLARKVKRKTEGSEEAPWDEVWMHTKPAEESVRRYREERQGWWRAGEDVRREDGAGRGAEARDDEEEWHDVEQGGDDAARHTQHGRAQRRDDRSVTLREENS